MHNLTKNKEKDKKKSAIFQLKLAYNRIYICESTQYLGLIFSYCKKMFSFEIFNKFMFYLSFHEIEYFTYRASPPEFSK